MFFEIRVIEKKKKYNETQKQCAGVSVKARIVASIYAAEKAGTIAN